VKKFLESISSFLIAIAILLGILFLPKNSYESLQKTLNYFSKGDNTTISYLYYMLQKFAILGVAVILTIAFHRVYKSRK